MLKQLFSSQTRIKIITFFFENPEESFFVREISRKINGQINSVRRELENLKSFGLLLSKNRENKKYYAINPDFIFYEELKTIFLKSQAIQTNIAPEIAKLGKISLVYLMGMFIGNDDSSVDLLVVGDLSSQKLQNFIDKHFTKEAKYIRYTILSEEDFRYRLEHKDKFVLDIVRNPANILALNKSKIIQKYLKK